MARFERLLARPRARPIRAHWALFGLLGLFAGTDCANATGGTFGGSGGSGGAASCAVDQVLCDGSCVSLDTNSANCGTCGTVCSAGRECVHAVCACLPGMTDCSGQCLDTQSSGSNCGACGVVCATGQVCSLGGCVGSCAAGLTQCGNSCVDTNTDPTHCGACGNACTGGQSCVNRTCQCAAGQTLCGASCVDTNTDPSNCGSCARVCSGGAACSSGNCVGATGGTGGTGGTTGGTGGTTGGTGGTTGGTGGTTGGTGGTTGGTGGTTGGTGGTPSGLLVPAQGALLGAYIGSGTVDSTETQIGRNWALRLEYFDWPLDFVSFARTEITAGRIPYVTWEPWNVTLDSIASGAQDTTIRTRAQAVRGLGGKVMLRFAHEMNGNWYPWDGTHNGNDASAPPKYIAAYRHIHDVFAAQGVTNVVWIFCPNVDSVPNATWNVWQSYYPGDGYVDWMGYDGYNWGTDTFASMTSRIYSTLASKNKPILLGETSTHDLEKANWINAIIPAMKTSFPLIKGLVWFHINKENDWRYDSTTGSLDAFRAMANNSYFNP